MSGKCIQSNLTLQKVFGYSRNELIDIPLQKMVHPDDVDKVLESYVYMHQCGEDSYYHKDMRYLRKNGEVLWGRVITSLVRDMQGNPCFTITMFEDVTERKQVEEEMRLAKLVYQFSNEAIQVTDADNHIIAINPAFTEITGYTKQEAVGKNSSLLKSGRHDKAFYAAMWRQLNASGKWQGEIWNSRKNGEQFVEKLSINTIYNDDATVHRRVALFSDITEKKKHEERIWTQANFDALTDLPNRHLFREHLEREIKNSQKTQLSLAMLFMDLDRFKEVNDTLGHEVGDLLLKEAAKRVKGCLRKSDTVGRFGGDEFTIILSELSDIDCIDSIVSELLLNLAMPFQLGNEVIYISACIGVALYPNDATDVTTLLKCADQAMYAAKNAGENNFRYYTSEMQDVANVRMRLIKDMHTALAEDQFRVHYQPIVDLATGYIRKAEALIRWHHPELGLISPTEFIPIAEETGLIVEIGDWVFYQAVAQTVHIRANHNPEFQISINKSPVQFMADTNHHSHWLTHLEELGLPKQVIVIEITEGLLMEAKDQISSELLTFRDNGIQVALDDFGTGYSSLSYLKKFDIDYIKIDQSFVSNLATGTNDIALCEAMIKMAHELDIRVIAEGVETEDQLMLLKQMGCDFGQGYFFSKPLPSEEFEKMLYKHPAKYSGDLFDMTMEEPVNTIQ
jgi:diguanylate cyclase (GGDEF)-like protein/PAS domain S-box-containing protein